MYVRMYAGTLVQDTLRAELRHDHFGGYKKLGPLRMTSGPGIEVLYLNTYYDVHGPIVPEPEASPSRNR